VGTRGEQDVRVRNFAKCRARVIAMAPQVPIGNARGLRWSEMVHIVLVVLWARLKKRGGDGQKHPPHPPPGDMPRLLDLKKE
jgi:hypothetical protein